MKRRVEGFDTQVRFQLFREHGEHSGAESSLYAQ